MYADGVLQGIPNQIKQKSDTLSAVEVRLARDQLWCILFRQGPLAGHLSGVLSPCTTTTWPAVVRSGQADNSQVMSTI